MKQEYKNLIKQESGFVFILVIVVTGFFLVFFGGMISVSLLQQKLYEQEIAKEQAFNMAEAGINYYTWHLAHDFDDFFDGTGGDPGEEGSPYGPYEHSLQIPNSDLTGYYSLEIYPPEEGSTVVTIKSTGWVSSHANIKKTVEIQYGRSSLANYSFLTNGDVWFGDTEKTEGQVHSNGGVRMDGENDSVVSSARDEYICYSGHGCTYSTCFSPCEWRSGDCYCPGVWGDGPNSSLWSYPEQNIDFDAITLDIAEIKEKAQEAGEYFAQSGAGYHVIFDSDGTFDIYQVSKLESGQWQQNDNWDDWEKVAEEIKKEDFIGNYAIPDNGLIFVEDDVWVEGTINGKVTLVSAILPDSPSTRTTIFINNNINYLSREDDDILGLIAQKDIKVPRHAPTDLIIDAMLLAQQGRVFRNYYYYHLVKDNIEVYGSIITNKTWTWSWVSGEVTTDGYQNTTSIFDPQITYLPPPFFPTFGEYEIISWNEGSWNEL